MKSFVEGYKIIITCIIIGIFSSLNVLASNDKDFPPPPNPPKLVNDFAGFLTPTQRENLELLLTEYEKESSTQITIVTVTSLGSYEVEQYATELGHRWGVGMKGKDNGVVILASKEDRKINISTGYGVEGVITDGIAGTIIRQEIVPEFKSGNYYAGFRKAADAIIDATRGEYTNDGKGSYKGDKAAPPIIMLIIIAVILGIIFIGGKGGGKGGGDYVSRRGGDFLTGALLGSLLSGGRSGGSFGGSSGGGFGGGFGGFGGGGFGGGGASGSW